MGTSKRSARPGRSDQTPRVIVMRCIDHLWACRGDGRWAKLERYLVHLLTLATPDSPGPATSPRGAVQRSRAPRGNVLELVDFLIGTRQPTYEARGGQHTLRRPRMPSRIPTPPLGTKPTTI